MVGLPFIRVQLRMTTSRAGVRDVPLLAKKPPLPTGSTPPNPHYMVVRSFAFHREAWKGYEHRMTKGERAHGNGTTGEGGEDRTWEFCIGRVNAAQ